MSREWRESSLWSGGNRIYQENKRVFLSMFDENGGSLLDLGCRDGEFTEEIGKHVNAEKIAGADLDAGNVEACKAKGIEALEADLNGRFPFDDGSFDAVAAHQVLEHLWNTGNFFNEIHRVLKPGGYAVISTPNLSSLHSIAFILRGWQPTILHVTDQQVGNPLRGTRIEQPGHIKAFNYSSLKDLARIHGFTVEKIRGYGFHLLPTPLQKILSKPLGRWTVFLTIKIRKKQE